MRGGTERVEQRLQRVVDVAPSRRAWPPIPDATGERRVRESGAGCRARGRRRTTPLRWTSTATQRRDRASTVHAGRAAARVAELHELRMQRLPDGPAEIGESAYDRGGRPQAPPRILADQANANGGRPVGGRSIKSPQVTVRARQAPVEGLHMRMAKRAHGLSSRKHPGSATVTDMDLGAVAQ